MHSESLHRWQCRHDYLPATQHSAERRTRIVVGLTLATMIVELTAGYVTGSMALIADGWHMGSHAAALGIAAFAYAFARRHVDNRRFSFGTGKVGSLAGFTSAVVLAVIALAMAAQSAARFWAPVHISFDEALWVACLGLAVNIVCAMILSHRAQHVHGRHDAEELHAYLPNAPENSLAHTHHHDHNLRSAYLHVLADALTSLLAIVALTGGKLFGWIWLDPMTGIVGAVLILHWSYGLVRESGAVLLDAENHDATCEGVRHAIEAASDDRVADLHVWRIGPQSRACILSLVTHDPKPAEHYKARLERLPGLDHITVEVNLCA
jgi:cation diffusion facilitator family transporter